MPPFWFEAGKLKRGLRQRERTTEPPEPARVFAWRQTMSMEEARRFHSVAGDLLKELGYET